MANPRDYFFKLAIPAKERSRAASTRLANVTALRPITSSPCLSRDRVDCFCNEPATLPSAAIYACPARARSIPPRFVSFRFVPFHSKSISCLSPYFHTWAVQTVSIVPRLSFRRKKKKKKKNNTSLAITLRVFLTKVGMWSGIVCQKIEEHFPWEMEEVEVSVSQKWAKCRGRG